MNEWYQGQKLEYSIYISQKKEQVPLIMLLRKGRKYLDGVESPHICTLIARLLQWLNGLTYFPILFPFLKIACLLVSRLFLSLSSVISGFSLSLPHLPFPDFSPATRPFFIIYAQSTNLPPEHGKSLCEKGTCFNLHAVDTRFSSKE